MAAFAVFTSPPATAMRGGGPNLNRPMDTSGSAFPFAGRRCGAEQPRWPHWQRRTAGNCNRWRAVAIGSTRCLWTLFKLPRFWRSKRFTWGMCFRQHENAPWRASRPQYSNRAEPGFPQPLSILRSMIDLGCGCQLEKEGDNVAMIDPGFRTRGFDFPNCNRAAWTKSSECPRENRFDLAGFEVVEDV